MSARQPDLQGLRLVCVLCRSVSRLPSELLYAPLCDPIDRMVLHHTPCDAVTSLSHA